MTSPAGLLMTWFGAALVIISVIVGGHIYAWELVTWVLVACFWVTVAWSNRD